MSGNTIKLGLLCSVIAMSCPTLHGCVSLGISPHGVDEMGLHLTSNVLHDFLCSLKLCLLEGTWKVETFNILIAYDYLKIKLNLSQHF